jgi:hypothetical protein
MTVKVNANELILLFYDIIMCINPVTMKNKNLETIKVKFLDLLYLTIVHAFVFTCNIRSFNTYTIILIHVFLILSFGVERISIYVVPLIFHIGDIFSFQSNNQHNMSFIYSSKKDLKCFLFFIEPIGRNHQENI